MERKNDKNLGLQRKQRDDKYTFMEEDLKTIAELAQSLMPFRAIAHYFGISLDTFQRRMEDDPRIREAIKQGRARSLAQLNKVALEKALSGDVGLLKYYIGKYESIFIPEMDKKSLFSPENFIDQDEPREE